MHSLRRAALVLTFLPVFASGCTSPGGNRSELACTLVLLKTGATTKLTPEESRRVFAGHFANMSRLAREGNLLLAGPYGQRKHDPMLRGLFVLDTADPARARRLAETDPGVRAGVFALEYHTLATTAPLRDFLVRELVLEDQATREGRVRAPGEGGRGYVLLTATNGERAAKVLQHHPATLLFGRLDESAAFVVLDAQNPDALPPGVAALLPELGEVHLDAWFASGGVATMARSSAH